MANLFAGDINLDPKLTDALGGVSTSAKGSLADQYGKLKTRFNSGGVVSGRPASDYNAERMGATQGLGEIGIDNSLEGVLGDTSYKDALSERDFQQSMDLAKRIGALNKPSLFQEIFSGLGSAAGGVGQYYGTKSSITKALEGK